MAIRRAGIQVYSSVYQDLASLATSRWAALTVNWCHRQPQNCIQFQPFGERRSGNSSRRRSETIITRHGRRMPMETQDQTDDIQGRQASCQAEELAEGGAAGIKASTGMVTRLS